MDDISVFDFEKMYFEHCECGLKIKGYSKTMTVAKKHCYRLIFEHKKTEKHKVRMRKLKINKILNVDR